MEQLTTAHRQFVHGGIRIRWDESSEEGTCHFSWDSRCTLHLSAFHAVVLSEQLGRFVARRRPSSLFLDTEGTPWHLTKSLWASGCTIAPWHRAGDHRRIKLTREAACNARTALQVFIAVTRFSRAHEADENAECFEQSLKVAHSPITPLQRFFAWSLCLSAVAPALLFGGRHGPPWLETPCFGVACASALMLGITLFRGPRFR
jgi:hypothetical protein